ncbi:DUF2207 domain-containing protein [Clostridium vincentii]|uniref:DUF2207 domain-containing protein n=1 Tax=Clostridium vincentii TaxID=52704 RepID=A0A2T0BII1_9CLOT|nr:DUF2207 domain-containing protein [Clostridium vincentii]PRR83698.1 hypothetical protein CLVI_06450 [Clostridium vincentii]
MFYKMKQFIAKFIFIVMILGVVSLMIYGIFFSEKDNNYSFDHLHYDVQMLSDGDSIVSEERTYTYKEGNFTRGYFEIDGEVEDIAVFENGIQYKQIPNFDENRPEGSYAFKKQGDITNLEWYMKASAGEERTFIIGYKMKNTTTLYNDCAIYFQKFLSQKNTVDIDKLTVSVQLAPGANKDNTLIWGHGPSDGNLEFDKENNGKVTFQLNNVPVKNYVEARFVLDRNLMASSKYIHNEDMRDLVIVEETAAAKEADRNRRIAGFSSLTAYLLAATLVILPIVLRIKKREHFTRFIPEMTPTYYRDIPENIPPAVLDKLYCYYDKGGKISNQVSGTFIDMIYRKIIIVSYRQKGRKTETYISLAKKEYKANEITEFEKSLIRLFFTDIAQGREAVSMNEIKKFCKQKKNVDATSKMIDTFSKKVDAMWNRYKYVENKKNIVPKVFTLLIIISLVIAVGAFSLFSAKVMPLFSGAYLILIVGASLCFIITLIVSRSKKMLNQKGENFLALWKGFYKFLNDLTLLDEKELPELFMWERYLVYATVLGVAEKVLKVLKLRYPQLNDEEFVKNNMIFFASISSTNMNSIGGLNDMTSSIKAAVRDAQNVISNIASSSSSGNGGGFSSGGSSGGSGSGGSTGGGMD